MNQKAIEALNIFFFAFNIWHIGRSIIVTTHLLLIS